MQEALSICAHINQQRMNHASGLQEKTEFELRAIHPFQLATHPPLNALLCQRQPIIEPVQVSVDAVVAAEILLGKQP